MFCTDRNSAHHVVVCSISKETSKSDDGREASKVQEDEGGKALYVKCISEVAGVKADLSFDIIPQAAKYPERKQTHTHTNIYIYVYYNSVSPELPLPNSPRLPNILKENKHKYIYIYMYIYITPVSPEPPPTHTSRAVAQLTDSSKDTKVTLKCCYAQFCGKCLQPS